MTRYWCELAWLGGPKAERGVALSVDGELITELETGLPEPPTGAVALRGLTLPGLANAHSHAFHRALRGHAQTGAGSFWTWRSQMYRVADRLDPDLYHALARATFAEMALAGVTVVGEFHYVHHRPGGHPYADPNAMGEAILAAASEVGIRITLLDTCYLHGGLAADGYQPLSGGQLRFSDRTAAGWVERVEGIRPGPATRIGGAVHSVRAVDPDSMAVVAKWARAGGVPLHLHLSEQPAENKQCDAVHGVSPTRLIEGAGLLEADLTAVHATHLGADDIAILGAAGAACCLCPTTERDLADGIGPARHLADSGARLCLGSDSHAVIDLFEEARAVELDARLDTLRRGNHQTIELLTAATGGGYSALGWPSGGRLEVGGLADFTTVGLDSTALAGTTAGSALESVVFGAGPNDVSHVVVGGEMIVEHGDHRTIDVADELRSAIREVLTT